MKWVTIQLKNIKKKTYKAGEMWVDFKLVAEPIVKYKECELNSTNKSQVEYVV
jgi:hypothetical protein